MLNRILNNLKEHPDDACYQIRDRIYYNRDLYGYVCRIRKYLLENCEKQDRIVVCGHKEIYMLASFLACAFAGMTYIPVDVSIPSERRENIIAQARPRLVIDAGITDVMENGDAEDFTDVRLGSGDVVYIIFTSGTTGEPKGVQITRSNLESCMNWLDGVCGISGGVVLNQANYSFDLSVADLYLPLITRSKHFIIERDTQKDFPLLFSELKRSGASLAVMTPSYADLLMTDRSFGGELMPELETILFCGEKLSEKTVARLYERFPGIRIINCYGPTECTFAVTGTTVRPGEAITLGDPKPDVDLVIVKDGLAECAEGETGEILIAGASVGAGYLNAALNENVFVDYNGKRAYLTGDLAYKKDGGFFYVGRKDRQIKYKGYRIELSEIEKVLNALDQVEKAVVTTVGNGDRGVRRIMAFVKLRDGAALDANGIKQYAQKRLPEYMVPVIRIVDTVPLNENGKFNEKAISEDRNERNNS